MSELAHGTKLQPVLDDPSIIADPSRVSCVVLLTGKLYYDLAKERTARGLDGRGALVQIGELSPFPFADVRAVLARYAGAGEVIRMQEEPQN